MTISASSANYTLADSLWNLADKETSFARKFATDPNNTSAITWAGALRTLLRTVNELDGLSASTATLNKAVAGDVASQKTCSTVRFFDSATKITPTTAGMTTIAGANVTNIASTAPGVIWAGVKANVNAAGTLVVSAYGWAAATTNEMTACAATLRYLVTIYGA